MKLPNSIRIAANVVFDRIFESWWSWYYRFFDKPPRHFYEEESDTWALEHWDEEYDPVCFPLPLRINCLGCHGCGNNSNPPLGQDKPKGPWKIFVSEEFCEDYEGLAGKDALVELLWDLEKSNMEIDKKNGLR